jgi:predicted transcriptional regulator
MKIHEAIKYIIDESDHTIQDWANISGLERAQLSKFLSGKRDIRVQTLQNILKAMNKSQQGQFQFMVFSNSD